KLRPIESGYRGFTMEAGDEERNRRTFRKRELAGVNRFEQREIALLRVVARLHALRADAVQCRSRFDPGERVDDILRTHQSASCSAIMSTPISPRGPLRAPSWSSPALARPYPPPARSIVEYRGAA